MILLLELVISFIENWFLVDVIKIFGNFGKNKELSLPYSISIVLGP